VSQDGQTGLFVGEDTNLLLSRARAAGEDGLAAFEFLMQAGARYNSQAWKALSALPPAPPPPRGADPPPPLARGLRGDLFGRPR